MEEIFGIIVCTLLLICFTCMCIGGIWLLIINPYFNYKIHQNKNLLQWRAEEKKSNEEKRLNNEINYYLVDLSYRILPNNLSISTKIFGSNDWKYPFDTEFKFNNYQEYKNFIDRFKFYKDIKDFLKTQNNKGFWYVPEE